VSQHLLFGIIEWFEPTGVSRIARMRTEVVV